MCDVRIIVNENSRSQSNEDTNSMVEPLKYPPTTII
jgi:hypothetical protein